jgi:hypothetical protein
MYVQKNKSIIITFFFFFSVKEPRDLEGVLAVNNKLNGAERIGEGELLGPEGFAVANNTLYFGIRGGEIKKLSPGGKISTVINLGHPCGKYAFFSFLYKNRIE